MLKTARTEIRPFGLNPAGPKVGEQPPQDLIDEILRVLPDVFSTSCGNPRGAIFEVIDDVGGHNLCDHASEELMGLLEDGCTIWTSLRPWERRVIDPGGCLELRHCPEIPEDYPDHFVGELSESGKQIPAEDHCVLYYRGWMIDITARQFDKKLPFPFFWRP